MSIKLRNTSLYLEINEPGKHYRGARFDWTGQIIQITFQNKHTFCTAETLDKGLINKRGRGLYNEFGIDEPPGYSECPVGGKFPKIGVGFLTKESDKPYDFFHDYEISPYSFSYSAEKTKAKFYCETPKEIDGFAFRLEKLIELNDNSFTIYYTLVNLGKRTISTNEYVHNFLSINGKNINEDYELTFPFKVEEKELEKVVNPQEIVRINNNTLTWNSNPEEEFFFDCLNTSYRGTGEWKLINRKERAGIRETTDFNIVKINLWGTSHVVSPEIFFAVNVAPGRQLSWSRTYTLFTVE